jgi:folate-dependent phosphoribosylglycinamide formyltransferase PurN
MTVRASQWNGMITNASSEASAVPTRTQRASRSRANTAVCGAFVMINERNPIRVVLFGGAYLQPGAQRFLVLIAEHPEMELVGGFCEGEGQGWRYRLTNVWRRRGFFALPVLLLEGFDWLRRFLRNPVEGVHFERRLRRAMRKVQTVPDIHAPDVLDRVRALAPDIGVIYGAPVLRPELFKIPRLGTLGIHHGRVPDYRGKKTTFWEIYNGEPVAGVTIQRVNKGIDTGEIVKRGEVEIGNRGYTAVERDTEALGLSLFAEAIVDLYHGQAAFTPQKPRPAGSRLYRQPGPKELLTLWFRTLRRRLGLRQR